MLSDKEIHELEAGEFPQEVEILEGLCLLIVWPNLKRWRFSYKFEGKKKTVSLGKFPSVSSELAIHLSQLMNDWVKQGLDPRTEKRKYREQLGHWPPSLQDLSYLATKNSNERYPRRHN